jgi:hypothetical protein
MAKFQQGNPGGPGRPRKAIEDKYLKSFYSIVKLSDWKDIVDKAREQAKRGDPKARQWLAEYMIGKPLQPIDMDHSGDIRFIVEYADGLQDKTTQST